MTEYEIRVMGRGGRVARSIYLDCADDAVAIEETRQFIDGPDIELWQVDRLVTRFDGKSDGMSWSRRFDDPIRLPKGKPLVTLKDAAAYIMALPNADWERGVFMVALCSLNSFGAAAASPVDVGDR